MTNFDYLLALFSLSPKYFLAAGFDHTRVSRWRSGKLRLMPGRRQVKIIAGLFCEADAQREVPLLDKLLHIWYPAEPMEAEGDKQNLLERFLTEKKQGAPEYRKVREARLGYLLHYDSDACDAPQGMEAVRIRMLDFLDLIDKLAEPLKIYFVFTEGQFAYLNDTVFRDQLMTKLLKLFRAGCHLMIAARIDRAVSDAWYFRRIRERIGAHLQGHIFTYLYHDFRVQGATKILGLVPGKLAMRVTRNDPWDYDRSYVQIDHDPETISDAGRQIHAYFNHARLYAHYNVFAEPEGWLDGLRVPRDQACYLFMRLPHLGVATIDAFAESFNLSGEELVYLQREFMPFTLTPSYFDRDVPVRHIFCETAIDHALHKTRHQSYVLSAILKRRVMMSRSQLLRQLTRIGSLSAQNKNYEVCFLDDIRFGQLSMQAGLWGNEATVCWHEGRPAVAGKDSYILAGMQGVCAESWDEIPAALRSRQAAAGRIRHWLRAAAQESAVGSGR